MTRDRQDDGDRDFTALPPVVAGAAELRRAGGVSGVPFRFIGEEPLSIRVEGKPYAMVMRTPGREIDHAAGFCLSEGIVEQRADIGSIACCDDGGTNVVTVTLAEARRVPAADVLERKSFVSQTSCGVCGKEMVKDLCEAISPVEREVSLPWPTALDALLKLSDHQPLRMETRAAHAAALYNADFSLLSIAEDVGRHNALDKAVGTLFMEDRLAEAALLTLSSRISYELVQKAGRAKIPVVLAISRPTALAVELARSLNITLACLSKESGLFVFSCPERLV